MKEIFRHAVVYGLAPMLQKAASLILLPLYTHYLTPRDYGEVELVVAVTGAVALPASLNIARGSCAPSTARGRRGTTQLFSALGAGGPLERGVGHWSLWQVSSARRS